MTRYLNNNTDFAIAYNVSFLKGTYNELSKPTKRKERYTKDWPDQSGTERDVTAPTFESRTLTLPVMIKSIDAATFKTKQLNFFEWIKFAGYFNFKCEGLNRQYTLLYSEVSNYKTYGDRACTFDLILIDDYPHIISPIS